MGERRPAILLALAVLAIVAAGLLIVRPGGVDDSGPAPRPGPPAPPPDEPPPLPGDGEEPPAPGPRREGPPAQRETRNDGRIVDAEGRPVAGARIVVGGAKMVRRTAELAAGPREIVRPDLPGLLVGGRIHPFGHAPSKTDAEGRFRLDRRAEGELYVYATGGTPHRLSSGFPGIRTAGESLWTADASPAPAGSIEGLGLRRRYLTTGSPPSV